MRLRTGSEAAGMTDPAVFPLLRAETVKNQSRRFSITGWNSAVPNIHDG